MFYSRRGIQPQSEYYNSLFSFVRRERKAGMISTKKSHYIKIVKVIFPIGTIVSLVLLPFCISFFLAGSSLLVFVLLPLLVFMSFLLIAIFFFLPGNERLEFGCIEGCFDDDALVRLYASGAPDDVIDKAIKSVSRNGTITYSQLYEIFLSCSIITGGKSNSAMLVEHYTNVKEQIRLINLRKGKFI